MEINKLLSESFFLFIPVRFVFLFIVLFAISAIEFRKRIPSAFSSSKFFSTLFIAYLLPVSFVTIAVLIPLDTVWILATGYEFPLNWFLFLKSPFLIRIVKILSDAIFSFLLTDSVMRHMLNSKFLSPFINKNLGEEFRKENRRSEMFKIVLFVLFLMIISIWKAR